MAGGGPDYAESCIRKQPKTQGRGESTRHSPELGIVPESMGIGFGDAGGLAMMTEQRTETRGRHAFSACASFQANKQGRAAVRRTFQTQVIIE